MLATGRGWEIAPYLNPLGWESGAISYPLAEARIVPILIKPCRVKVVGENHMLVVAVANSE